MQQDELHLASEKSEPSARPERRRRWMRWIGAGALALTLGIGQASADALESAHEGGQGRDKNAAVSASAFARDGAAKAASFGGSGGGFPPGRANATVSASAIVDGVENGAGAWTRTSTQTITRGGAVISVTRSISYAADEDGNTARASGFAKAKAPTGVGVHAGERRVTTKTSVAVTGNGIASADAGGSIGVGKNGGVKVSTWGRTSAEVF